MRNQVFLILNDLRFCKFKKILSPEFSFTKMTMREMLQQVGGVIHGEPRIKDLELIKENGLLKNIRYVVGYDKYGEKEYSSVKDKEYFSTGAKTDIKNFCKKDKKFSKNPLTIIFLCFILCIQ